MPTEILRSTVHQRMEDAGLSRRALAQTAGLSETTVHDILKGRVDSLNGYLIGALARVFGCSSTDLVGDDPDFLTVASAWVEEMYVALSVEADGDDPGSNTMMSFGAAAYTIDKRLIGRFATTLAPPPDASGVVVQTPEAAMTSFASFIDELAGGRRRPVFMGYPGAFDVRWINAYSDRHLRRHPLGISALCLKSFGIDAHDPARARGPERPSSKRKAGAVGTLSVAIETGAVGIDLLREFCGLAPIRTVRLPT